MSRSDELIVGLDVGTTKICAVVAERSGDSIDVIGIGSHPSKGLRRGVVVDIDATNPANPTSTATRCARIRPT